MLSQKGNSLFIGIAIGLLIALVFFAGYYFLASVNNNSSNEISMNEASSRSDVLRTSQSEQVNYQIPQLEEKQAGGQISYGNGDLKFDITQIREGESFGEMTVKSIEPFNAEYGGLSEENFRVTFLGKITLSGDYFIMDGTEMGNGRMQVNFRPDEPSYNLLPREKVAGEFGYARSFVFNNYDKAVELLLHKGKNGPATVIIDNYTLVGYPSEISNSADLVEVK